MRFIRRLSSIHVCMGLYGALSLMKKLKTAGVDMDLGGHSTCLPFIELRQWSFCIPGFICYLNGAFRNYSLLKLNSKKGI